VKASRTLLILGLALVGVAATQTPWENLTEADWIYALATRFSLVDGHTVHYPTPTAELAKLLEGRKETAALRHLAEAKLNLGDRKGAVETMEKWATAEGPAAWDEAARWAATHKEMGAAFRAAEKALPGLPAEAKRALADQRIQWALAYPDIADPLAMRKARAELFPQDPQALEDYVRALEQADRLPEADQALAASKALPPERRLLLRADLMTTHGDYRGAFQVLDAAAAEPWSMDFRQAYARRVYKGASTSPATWRATLESRFDAPSLVRLATYFQGQGRGDAASDLLRQMDRRYGKDLSRPDQLLMARLLGEIDAAPEAFRATLAAAHLGNAQEQTADLATLARLALRAGGRPLAWGTYNDESYRWVASMDRTPGFWTGGVSFLLTGQNWKEPLEHLESESLPDRTFATARMLADELARRQPQHPDLASLRVAIMERHVERGEGREALAMLPLVESASPAVADDGRRVALMAARQVEVPRTEELRLYKARLKFKAPDGSRPAFEGGSQEVADASEEGEEGHEPRPWAQRAKQPQSQDYRSLFEEAMGRMEERDPSHYASLDLTLTELDRLPDAEGLWMSLAERLEHWNLDDELGPRYERALKRFQGSGIWDKMARWYARRGRHSDLKRLAEDVSARFEATEIFRKVGGSSAHLEIPDQPIVGGRVRMVEWADWVRYRALQRFPHSPLVFREASSRLMSQSAWAAHEAKGEAKLTPREISGRSFNVIVPDALLSDRRWAIFFVEASEREQYFSEAMRQGTLESQLTALEAKADRTPVDDLLLFEGWSRLSRFEKAVGSADRLAASYPGDGPLAQRVLSLHRSLNGLESSHGAQAAALVARTAPALEEPSALWTELGELEEDRGRPEAAKAAWTHILEREPRNPKLISDLATLLWDYNHDREALTVVEEGRKRLGRPRFFAFETGVLRENVKDLEGAVREYLDALRPEDGHGYRSWYEEDQRSLRRLEQLLSRERVFSLVEKRIQSLNPGVAEDERTLAAFFPLASIRPPAPGQEWDADAWIDGMDQPNDPVGRAQRGEKRADNRPKEYDAVRRMGDVLLEKARTMVPKASSAEFLDSIEMWSRHLIESRWDENSRVVFQDSLMARKAALAPSEEDRIQQDMARADFLAGKKRGREADAVWAALDQRINALPEGSVRLRAEAGRAAYLERSKGVEPAAQEWRRITDRHPWSLGLLEDRLAFLNRSAKGEEARALLEAVAPKAAAGHREALLERLTQESLAAQDLPRARRAVTQLLSQQGMEDEKRLPALHLLARLSYKENPAWDVYAFAKTEAPKVKPELQADFYQQMARAADLENIPGPIPGLWIEALNRRTERDWLDAASRSSRRMGKGQELLTFFEKQHDRSPRDVRWAVAVRDLRRDFHQVDGAIEAAKSAVTVRPEKENLWREAADLMIRADRVHEAADYLDGWNRPRPADEGVAGWRSKLYAQAGDGERALAIEQGALAAYGKEAAKDAEGLAYRKARAAERLLDYGYADLALRLCSTRNDVRELGSTKLAKDRCAQIALLTNQYVRWIASCAGDESALRASAGILSRQGRFEQREEVQAALLKLLIRPDGSYSESVLNTWWPFIRQAGLEAPFRMALSRHYLSRNAGPWQSGLNLPYMEEVGRSLVQQKNTEGGSRWVIDPPNLWRLWAVDLARRDRAEELLAFLEPRWQELIAAVKGMQWVNGSSPRQAWAEWMDDRHVLFTWCRAAAAHPEKVRELSEVMSDRKLWDRFWVLGARNWNADTLVAILPQESRLAWFRFWETGAASQDPVLVARHRSVEQVSLALGRLIQGAPGSAQDALIVKLRGPQTVGDVMGQEARWVWPEFNPRRNAKGEIAEEGDDRVTGNGVDQGRVPGPLWGDRPGEAWYVLEALARYRQGDHVAPLLPLDVPQRGGETGRTLLAMRMARGMSDLPLALSIAVERPGHANDRAWLDGRITLLVAANQKDKAADAFKSYVRNAQIRLTEEEFRWLSSHAEDWGLPSPMDLLDTEKPVGPAFLAYLRDRRPEAAGKFNTLDPSGYRAALAQRWSEREGELNAGQIRYWLKELWAKDSASLPSLRALGGPWLYASGWLQQQPIQERLGAIQAMEEALATPPVPANKLFTMLSGPGADEDAKLLAVRVRLARGEMEQALSLADAMLSDVRRGESLAFASTRSVAPATGEEGWEGSEGGEAAPSAPVSEGGDALVDRLKTWLQPFRDAKKATAVESRFRALLKERRQQGTVSTSAWAMAFGLTPAAELSALAQELDEAWFRGEVPPESLGVLAKTLVSAMPSEAPRWLARWPRSHRFEQAKARADLFIALKQPEEASKVLFESRRRGMWQTSEEVQAFDLWRHMGAPQPVAEKAPAYWAGALPVWTGKADAVMGTLTERLRAHAYDFLAARAALRSPAAAHEEGVTRASLALARGQYANSSDGDHLLLRLRAARGLLAQSPVAAHYALNDVEVSTLGRLLVDRRFRSAEINQALADLARIGRKSGDDGAMNQALRMLADRNAPETKALRAELAVDGEKPESYRLVNGRPTMLRPRDLTWTLVSNVLKAEGVR
jgi:hypothetical protein